jgi:hypothetical protein
MVQWISVNALGCLLWALSALMGTQSLAGAQSTRFKSDFSERGLMALCCFLDLSDPLGRCVGGRLTANSINLVFVPH